MNEEKFKTKVIETYGEWPLDISFGGNQKEIRQALEYYGKDSPGSSLVDFLVNLLPDKYLHIGCCDLLTLEGLTYYNFQFANDNNLTLGDWRAFMINDVAAPIYMNMKNGRIAVMDVIAMIKGASERPLSKIFYEEWADFGSFLDVIK